MKLDVFLTSVVHIFTALSFVFVLLSVILGWLLGLPMAYCFYTAAALLVVAVVLVLVVRVRPPTQGQVRAFTGAGWPSINIGHRGCTTGAPENTLIAVREACKNGSKFVEFDVGLTKDRVPVIMHDDTVDRTTNGTGAIKDLTLAEVSKLNAAAKHPLREKFPHASVPTLEEATLECLRLGVNIFFDVKDWSTEMVEALVDLYKRHPELYDKGIVCSFYPMVSYRVRSADPGIMTALSTCTYMVQYCFGCEDTGPYWKRSLCILGDYLLLWSQMSWLWIVCGNMATLLDKDIVTQDTVNYWLQRGIKTVVWTVNDKTEKEYFHRCLQCGIITDSVYP